MYLSTGYTLVHMPYTVACIVGIVYDARMLCTVPTVCAMCADVRMCKSDLTIMVELLYYDYMRSHWRRPMPVVSMSMWVGRQYSFRRCVL